ncbi:MAG: choice-of-anchor D domain-containing protein [Flavobacterium sp.]|nr:MAG: choice-of-anchor D domain-containing protein [Flavobacterium sp.]
MKRILLLIVIFIVGTGMAYSQVSLTNAAPTATIDFSNTMQTTVGTAPGTAYTGAGFAPAPAAGTFPGRLNSNAWETKGWSNGDLLFGGNMTNPAHGRGSVAAAVITEGFYAYTDTPASVANPTLMIQPGDAEFAPGSLTLRIKNNGTANMTQLTVSYNLFVRNDENSSNSFNFSHSPDNITFQQESAADYTSPTTADAFQWVLVDVAPTRSLVISGINVAPGAYYYIRWSCADVVVSGGRDEFGLDDIVVTGTYGAPAPEINVVGNTLSILSGDMTPSVPDGTQFANTFTGGSTSLIDYYIENVGGMPLNVTGVTITGANASDFVVQGAGPVGTIAAVSGSVVSKSILTIKFTPSAPGTRTAIINIANSDSNENPYTFMVQGLGVVPQPDMEVYGNTAPNTSPIYSTNMIPVTTNCTLFAPQIVGGPGQTLNYKIKNTGTAAILILTDPSPYITISGANPSDFTLTSFPTGATMGNGFTKFFSITFSPTAAGIRTAIVSIANNDVLPDVFGNSENPYTFLIQGTGIAPEIDITGNSQPVVDGSTTPAFANHTFFDYLNIGGTLDRVYKITNTGSMALTVGALTLSGSSDFSIITPPAASVPIGGTTTFTIRFSPTSSGLKTATVNLVNNDANENPYDFSISGFGLDYTPCSYGIIETIAVQDFETAPATPTWTYSTTGTSTVSNGVGFALSGDGGLSDRFLGARSLQVANSTATVTMNAVNTLQYSNIELNLRLSSLGLVLAEGNDATDKVSVSVSANGGTTWSSELEVRGNNNSKWSFSSGAGIATTVYDANNVATVFAPAATGFATSDGYSTLSITGLPKVAALMVRVTINNNASEIWAVDNVSLFGRKEIVSVWNGLTWSNGVPTATVKAIIDGNYDTAVNGNLQACKCQINAGKIVTIQNNQFFNVQSDLDNSGTITIENGGSLVQRNDLAVNAGNIIVKRYTTPMTRYDYTYWSSPVSGQTLFNLSPLTLSDKFFAFDPVINNWQNVPSSTLMTPGKGYIVRAPQNFSVTVPVAYTSGQFAGLTNNGFVQIPVAIGAGTWNLLGNPYPSAIDADLFLGLPANTGVVGGTIYFWTHNTPITNNQYSSTDYASYNLTGGVGTAAATAGINPTIPTGNIASGQGFFVAGLSNGQATFNNSMRLTGFNNEFFRPANSSVASPTGIAKHRIWLDLTNEQGGFKQTLVGYIEGASNELDRNFDGPVLEGGNPLSIYSFIDVEPMTIQGRALPFQVSDTVNLGYRAGVDGNYTISIEKVDGLMVDQDIYLEDKQLNIIHDLKAQPYVFSSSAGTFDNRFVLRYTTELLGTVDYSIGNGEVMISVKDKRITVQSIQENISEINLYDLVGRQIYTSKNIQSEQFTIDQVTGNQQTLIVKVKLVSGKIVNRKIIF